MKQALTKTREPQSLMSPRQVKNRGKRGMSGMLLRSLGARDHEATVVKTESLAPHMLRIHFHSDTIFPDITPHPTAWLRFWFPNPEGSNIEHQRAYTISDANVSTGDFAVDFVLHEPAGPASIWAVSAQTGDTISFTSLGSKDFELPQQMPSGFLLIGDSASLPAINTIIPIVPENTSIELYLEEHTATDQLIPLAHHPNMNVTWVPREGKESLANALEARDWSNWIAWGATESGTFKAIRTRLKKEFGFTKANTHYKAYWIEGRPMGN
ncbi:MAG: siderophore-interacting protein [Micrococcaceae bacterium]